jgi:hypothetical protein
MLESKLLVRFIVSILSNSVPLVFLRCPYIYLGFTNDIPKIKKANVKVPDAHTTSKTLTYNH